MPFKLVVPTDKQGGTRSVTKPLTAGRSLPSSDGKPKLAHDFCAKPPLNQTYERHLRIKVERFTRIWKPASRLVRSMTHG